MRDTLRPEWVHFLPQEGRMTKGVGFGTAYYPLPYRDDRRTCMLFDAAHMSPGEMLNGAAIYKVTRDLMGAQAAGDMKKARRLISATKSKIDSFYANPDEFFVPEEIKPSQNGVLAVGVITPVGSVSLRLMEACEMTGVPLIKAPDAQTLQAKFAELTQAHFAPAEEAPAAAATRSRHIRRARPTRVLVPREKNDLVELFEKRERRLFPFAREWDNDSRAIQANIHPNVAYSAQLDEDGMIEKISLSEVGNSEIGSLLNEFSNEAEIWDNPTRLVTPSFFDLNDGLTAISRFGHQGFEQARPLFDRFDRILAATASQGAGLAMELDSP
jgi:hypothetical protein